MGYTNNVAVRPFFRPLSTQPVLDFALRALPPLEKQPLDHAVQQHGFFVAPDHPGILPKYVEIGRGVARQPPQIFQPLPHRQAVPERHAVGVDDLKAICALRLLPVKDVTDIQVAMQNACPVHTIQETGHRIENMLRLLALGKGFGDGTQRQIVGVERHEVALPQDAVAARFDHCDLFGRTDTQIAQFFRMQIGALGLAFAQRAVENPVAERQPGVALHGELHAAGLETFDDVATVVQCLAVPGEKERVCQLLDKRPQMFVFGVEVYLHRLSLNRWV